MREPITVLIADEEPAVADSLRQLLTADQRFRVVAVASSGDEAVAMCLRERPDVALVDIDRGRIDGVVTTKRLRQIRPNLRIVAMGASHETDTIGPAIDAGASGYLPKAHAPTVLASTIERVAAGAMVFSDAAIREDATRDLEHPPGPPRAGEAMMAPLTVRELEVLRLIAWGRSTRSIAEVLGISVQTARSHVKKILFKLGVHSRVEAVALALRYQIVRIMDED